MCLWGDPPTQGNIRKVIGSALIITPVPENGGPRPYQVANQNPPIVVIGSEMDM